MKAQFAIGIDLGTTNTVLAFLPLGGEQAPLEILPIPQLVAPGVVEARKELPSFLYLPLAEEISGGQFALPWDQKPDVIAGEWARKQSADVPTRTVAAAKSWLCHSRVDRRAAILPWNAPDDVKKISPVEASRRYLAHLVAAWNQAHPEAPLKEQQVVLTVPASFDASARELTHEAALAAGLPKNFLLLEEPQAAVYSWLADHGEGWRRQMTEGDSLLVSDIGGGTTDFTLIRVESEEGDLVLRRQAVGDHILVGGDNMDLTLAHLAKTAFDEQGTAIDAWQSVSLWHACRAAKEALLTEGGDEKYPVTILGRGSKLIGGTVTTELEREPVAQILLDGFFPHCEVDAVPARRHASGFREMGLPYESDTAVTRHLAGFLRRHGEGGASVRPTHILFNGGVLKSPRLRSRLTEVVGAWLGGAEAIKRLEGNNDLDYAVARGAAFYGYSKQSGGLRIRGGTAQSYYIGIETAGLAIPGAPRPLSALCVVPNGMEEGTECDVPGKEIGLIVGEQVRFRFFSSTRRTEDRPGAQLDRWNEGDLIETDSLEAQLPAAEGVEDDFVPVHFRSRITELGMFELWCVSTVSKDEWKLEFSVREQDAQ
ncbi:MAG: Hsp70 family protein [Kiritimatiellae bacterium]|nr:Hsp70 family protein [Kiritimatiellia bacterium]